MGYSRKNQKPLIVIFGRTNVGKSTLFNCLTEKKKALTAKIEGTTRDSNLGEVDWRGYTISLVDTGGIMDIKYLTGKKIKAEEIETKVQKQARSFLKRADLILFLVDARDGLLSTDKELVQLVKKDLKSSKPIILVANKADSPRLKRDVAEFNKLGLGEPQAISAANGSGTGDLLDIIVNNLKKLKYKKPSPQEEKEQDESINVAIIGKPNVGKSSMLNSLVGDERIITSPVPHTTREPQDTIIEFSDHKITLIDTAGISKRGQKTAKQARRRQTLEKFSIEKSLAILRKVEIALLIIDIEAGLSLQEAKLAEEIIKRRISLILVANKWDLIKERNTKDYTLEIYRSLPFAQWAPIQFISALTGEKINKLLPLVIKVAQARKTEISPNALSKFLGQLVKKHKPTRGRGTKYPYIYELKQTGINPPEFATRVGARDSLASTYLSYIANRLREKFGFLGTPITVYVEKRKLVHGKHDETKKKDN